MGISTYSLKKSFYSKGKNETIILKDITLSILSGELVAIQGKSGAGKSTLLHIIGCLDTQTAGEYILDDKNISELSNNERAYLRNRKFGFIMQDYALINDETVIDNITLPSIFAKKTIEEAKQRAFELLAEFNIQDLGLKKVSNLSGGEKQRVAIVRALMNEPSYILADEPTGALDSKNANDIMNIFLELNKKGKTIIIVTHDNTIAKACNRIINISDGLTIE